MSALSLTFSVVTLLNAIFNAI